MPHHLLGDYLRSFVAVLLTQFSRKRFPGGMDGVVRLAEKSEPIQARLGSLKCMSAAGPHRAPCGLLDCSDANFEPYILPSVTPPFCMQAVASHVCVLP